MKTQAQFDEIGYWSQVKLEILKEYEHAYSTILAAQKHTPLHHVYIDAFAGAGVHVSKATGEFVPGSPLNALLVQPSFRDHYLIDIDATRVSSLRELIGERSDVHLFTGNCNEILLRDVFPNVQYADYRRGLCILDPYGLQLDWKVIQTAGEMNTIDLFLNFPVMDMNRNVLWHNPERVDPADMERMNAFWGDDSWRAVAYRTDTTLFGEPEKQSTEAVAKAFQSRLRGAGHFKWVPDPLPMRNSKGAIVYFLFLASQKQAAERVAKHIFDKYRVQGGK